jgi:hypothetical protein
VARLIGRVGLGVEAQAHAAAASIIGQARGAVRAATAALAAAAGSADRATDQIPGVRQVKDAMRFVRRQVGAVNDGISDRYGKTAGRAIVLTGVAVGANPLVVPPWVLAIPGSALLASLPLVAVAECLNPARGGAWGLLYGEDPSTEVTLMMAPDSPSVAARDEFTWGVQKWAGARAGIPFLVARCEQ